MASQAAGSQSQGLSLFPAPQRIELGGPGAPATAKTETRQDNSLPAEGFELVIQAGSVRLSHRDDSGLIYGRQALAQLAGSSGQLAGSSGQLAGSVISDWPDLTQRGYLLDVSRDRVPTMKTLRWLVDVLALCRINQLHLYSEHTFAFANHEEVWGQASPMTAQEMTELDELCVSRGIELVPCLNVFGHMGRWLKLDRYRQRAECPDGFLNPKTGKWSRPETLAPTADNAEFVVSLVREIAAAVTTKKVNICGDEALELGLGASRSLVADKGRGRVFVEHLNRIAEPLISEGHEVMFWDDMFRNDPDLIELLPTENATALSWQYEGSFSEQTACLAATNYPFMVAPGTANWNSFLGRGFQAKANLAAAVSTRASSGLLLTDWGDNGHMQPLALSVLPILRAGAQSWCRANNQTGAQKAHDASALAARSVLGSEKSLAPGISTSTGLVDIGLVDLGLVDIGLVDIGLMDIGLMEIVEQLSGLVEGHDLAAVNGSSLFYEILKDPPEATVTSMNLQVFERLWAELQSAERDLAALERLDTQGSELKIEIQATLAMASFGAAKMGRRLGFNQTDREQLKALARMAREHQEAAWLARSRPRGMDHSLERVTWSLA